VGQRQAGTQLPGTAARRRHADLIVAAGAAIEIETTPGS
jgi:hypothetical protein